MSNKFLLPCDCGRSVAVEVTQAGQRVTCSCGKQLAVPSLRAIRQLPPATNVSNPQKARLPTWNPIKGVLFAVGAVLVIVGVATAVYSYSIYQQASAFQPSETAYSETLVMIDKMTPSEVFDAWHHITEQGLEPAGSSPFAKAQEVALEKRRMMSIAVAMTVAGLLCALVPAFLRRS